MMSEENEDFIYTVLSDESYDKAVGEFRFNVNKVLRVFNMYGMGVHVESAQEEIVKLAEDFGQRIRGDLDKPISVEYIRRSK